MLKDFLSCFVVHQLDVKAILEEQQKRKQAEMALKDD